MMWFRQLLKKRGPTPKHRASKRAKSPKIFSLETMLKVMRPLPGEWESVLRGKGREFDRFKEFRPPDNPSLIHIPTLARTNESYIVQRVPRKGVEVTIIGDFSSSCNMAFSSEIRDMAVSLLAAGAVEKESPLAWVAFSDGIERIFPFDTPRAQFQRLGQWILQRSLDRASAVRKTSFRALTPYIQNTLPEKSLVFLVSDFLGEEGFEETLSLMMRRVDCTPVVIDISKMWEELPLACYEVRASDVEEGGAGILFLTPSKIREIREFHQSRKEQLFSQFRGYGFHYVVLDNVDIRTCMNAFNRCFRQKVQQRR